MNSAEVVLVFEETHLHASRQKMFRFDLGEPIMVRIMRQGRKFGVSSVAIDQSPSQLHDAVLANVATRIVLRLTNYPCVHAIVRTMGLDDRQEKALVELARRRALVQTADNPKPFVVEVVEIPERQRPVEKELLERERISLESLDHEMADSDALEVLLGEKKEQENMVPAAIRGDMHKVLARICESPWELIEERAEVLSIERAREYRARQNLEKLGMVEAADKVGAKWLLYLPTEKGRRWARSLGIKVPEFKSGIGHEYMVRRVKASLERFFGKIEFFPPGESLGVAGVQPDLLAGLRTRDGDSSFRMAVQISCANRAQYEVERAVEISGIAQIDLVVIVAKNKSHRRSIDRRLLEKGGRDAPVGGGRMEAEDGRKRAADGGGGDKPGSGGSGGRKEGEEKGKKGEENGCKTTFHFQKMRGRIVTVDFETCVSQGYDWSWVME